jgi:hypothetical protein
MHKMSTRIEVVQHKHKLVSTLHGIGAISDKSHFFLNLMASYSTSTTHSPTLQFTNLNLFLTISQETITSCGKLPLFLIEKRQDIYGFVDGYNVCPPQTITTQSNNTASITQNPAFLKWHLQDQMILSALISSLI